MEIVHSTKSENLLRILKQGIIPPSLNPSIVQNCSLSNPDYSYLTAVRGKSYLDIEKISFATSLWGNYILSLNLDWVNANASQFEERGFGDQDFSEFLDKLKIKIGNHPYGDKIMPYQIISLKPISLEGLSGLLLHGDPSSPTRGSWQISEEDLKLVEGCPIRTDDYRDKFINLKDFIPKWMELYIGNKSQTLRIN